MKNKVLIFISSYSIGGTISSLWSLLSVIDTNKLDVDIYVRSQVGPYEGKLPNCRVLDENVWLSHKIVHKSFFAKLLVGILWLIRQVMQLVGVDLFKLYNIIGGKQIHSEKYDAVIGYDETFARYISYIPANKRINWIHCDYRRFAKGREEEKYYDEIDAVVCVSNFVRGVFCDVFPEYKHKTYAIHNAINVEHINSQAHKPIEDTRFLTDCFTIISCGRLDPVKQFSKIPSIASRLKTINNIPFRWYIIGGGNEQEKKIIENEIVNNGVEDCVIMLGMKTNVYTYLAKSDLYVCTSYSESFPMVINEAKALGVPVLSNDFPSAKESIRDGVDGFLCQLDNMAECINKQMLDPMKIDKEHYINENSSIVEKVIELLEV